MFNRKLQVSVVKDEETQSTRDRLRDKDLLFNIHLRAVRGLLKEITRDVAIGMAGYVVLDTARQVAVTLANK